MDSRPARLGRTAWHLTLTTAMTFLEQYEKRADAADSLLCVSLDPDLTRLPPAFQKEAFPQFAFNKHIIEATHYYVGAYKLQMAF